VYVVSVQRILPPFPSVSARLAILTLLALTAPGGRALAAQQARQVSEPVREAVRVRDQGDMAAAVRLLEARIAKEPADADAFRLLAQTLYWMGKRDSARAVYDSALAHHPDVVDLRLEYGQMLVETRLDRRAREVLLPTVRVPAAAARAETLLGTSAYWSGDFTRAVSHFRNALGADSSATDARRQWREIAAATAGWLRFGSTGRHDDQPLDYVAPEIEIGGFINPLWSIRVRGEAAWYHAEPDPSGSVLAAGTTLSGYIPPLRLETRVSGGILRRSFASSRADWTGAMELRLRIAPHASLGARGERKPYFFTRASLASSVMIDEGALTLAVDHPKGWLGEGAYVRQRYSDHNTIESGYAWLLAPLARGAGLTLQAGYAVSAQHAQESRFVLADSTQAVPPGHPLFDPAGAYAPYYTPDHLIAHSAVAAVEYRLPPGGRIRLDASYAIHARDDAPVLEVAGAPPTVTLDAFRRSFSPWQLKGSLERRLGSAFTLYASAEHTRTVFYATTGASLSFVHRFSAAALRRVDAF